VEGRAGGASLWANHSIELVQEPRLPHLSALRGWFLFRFVPTAYAVGCILSPLRGYMKGVG